MLRTACESTVTSIPQRQIQQCFLQTQFSQYRHWSGRNNYHHSSSRCTFIFIQSREQNSHKTAWNGSGRQGEKSTSSPLFDSIHQSKPLTGRCLVKASCDITQTQLRNNKGTLGSLHNKLWLPWGKTICKELAKWLRNSNFSYIENVWELFLKLTLGLWLLLGSQWTQSESLHSW